MKKIIIVIAVLLAAPLTAHAQDLNFGALDENTNVVTVTTGAEDGLMLGTGYGRVLSVADRSIVLGGDLTLPWGDVDIDDFRLRASALAPIVEHGPWKLIGGLAAMVRGTKNDIARMIGVGSDVAIVAGRYAPRWFAAAELGFDWAIATHVEHSDAYRMTVYADARDGWYGNAGGMLRAGIEGGLSFGRHDVILRAGRLVDIAGDPAMFPFYGTLTFDTRW
jgi:hypothetical protein